MKPYPTSPFGKEVTKGIFYRRSINMSDSRIEALARVLVDAQHS